MFGNKNAKDTQFAGGGHTLLDRALEVQGNIRFGGILDIEGVVNGDIASAEGADAEIRVRDKGVVNGEIRAPRVIINGSVNGDIYATKHLELAAKAVVNGSVHYQVMEMVKGSQVNGALVHIEDTPEPKPKNVEQRAAASKPTAA